LTTPEKLPKRRGRRKKGRYETELAVVVGVVLGGMLAVLQLQEVTGKLLQVPEALFVMADVAAVILVAAALTKRVRTGLLCGAIAAISQLLTLIGSYAYSYTITVAIDLVPLQSLRLLMYPVAGLIGGYFGHHIATARTFESSRHVRRTSR
jgi:hypothetical protein